jgi:Flp pilus assembly protein TadG
MRRKLAQLLRDSTGVSAIEFAFVAPILLMFAGGTIQGGLLLHTWGNMEEATRNAARSVAVGALTATEAEAQIESDLATTPGTPSATATVAIVEGATDNEDYVTATTIIPQSELSGLNAFGVISLPQLRATVRVPVA